MPATPPSRPLRRLLGWLTGTILALLLALAGAVFWLIGTESGLQTALMAARHFSDERLSVRGASGKLLGPLSIDELGWRDPQQEIRATRLHLEWTLTALLTPRLDIARLTLETLHIRSRPSDEKTPPPEDLSLPLPLSIGHFAVGQLSPAAGLPTLAISGALDSDGVQHRLHDLRIAAAASTLGGAMALNGNAPFPLSADLELEHRGEHAFTAQISAGGDLHAPELALQVQGAAQGKAAVRLLPFADNPLARLQMALTGIDPAAWIAGAPRALFDIEADVRGTDADRIAGTLQAINRKPGRIDAQGIPLRRLHARIAGNHETLEIPAWNAELAAAPATSGKAAATAKGAGTLAGTARWQKQALHVEAHADNLDPAQLAARLQQHRLSGPLTLTADAATQTFTADLAGGQTRINARLHHTGSRLDIAALQLREGPARLTASGHLETGPPHAFALEAQLQRFDPARFARIPAGTLNAVLQANGQLQPEAALTLQGTLEPSIFAGHPVRGTFDLTLQGTRLARSDIMLAAGDNRLNARGAFGAAEDTLQLELDAPRLDQLGLGGSVHGAATLGGSIATPQGEFHLASPRLPLPGGGAAHGLALGGRLEAGAGGTFQISLGIEQWLAATGAQPIRNIIIDANGQRDAHQITLNLELPGKRPLATHLTGALADGPAWRGHIDTLTLGGALPLTLRQPARLQASAERLLLEAARLDVGSGEALLQRLLWTPVAIESAGQLRAFPAPTPPASDPASLRLDADWSLRLADTLEGSVHLRRRDGDLFVGSGSGRQALDLTQLDLLIRLQGAAADARLQLHGERFGHVDGGLRLPLIRQDELWQPDREAPLQGRLNLRTPSLDWLGPAIDANLISAGQLAGSVDVAGTLAAPQVNGTISGQALALRLVDQGLDLRDGRLRLQLSGTQITLDCLEFAGYWGTRPIGKKLPPALTATPGRLSARGSYDLQERRGSLQATLERVGVLQQTERWLALSGNSTLDILPTGLAIRGDLTAAAGHFAMPPPGTPTLGDDVFIKGRNGRSATPLQLAIDLGVDLGPALSFHGAGLETRLTGKLHLASDGKSTPRATGTIRTEDGIFEAWGTRLAVDRGLLNFQGLLDNPGLNIRALRRNLPVEAGVEVLGSVRQPSIRLVSEPEVPDTEKLSWLVLGAAPGQGSSGGAAALLSAAGSLFGRGGSVTRQLMQTFGVDEFSVGAGSIGGDSTARSRVVGGSGFGASENAGQLLTVGKRLAENVTLAYEQSLTSAETIVKLTLQLSQRLSLVGRAGSDTALDLFYTFAFGSPNPAPSQ